MPIHTAGAYFVMKKRIEDKIAQDQSVDPSIQAQYERDKAYVTGQTSAPVDQPPSGSSSTYDSRGVEDTLKTMLVGSILILIVLAIVEILLLIYSFMVIFTCFKGNVGLQILLSLLVLFVPFGSLVVSIYGYSSGCRVEVAKK